MIRLAAWLIAAAAAVPPATGPAAPRPPARPAIAITTTPPPPVALPPSDAEIVFELGQTGNRMTVPVSVAGSSAYPFIIDTGAERTVIARELAHVLALTPGPALRLTAMTGTSIVNSVAVPALAIDAIHHGPVLAPALQGRDMGALGILGLDALQSRAVALDFDRNRMVVRPSVRRARARAAEPGEIVVTAFSRMGQLIVTDAHYGTQSIQVVIDTGSAVTVGNGAFRQLVRNSTRHTAGIQLQSVTGGMLDADYAVVDQVKLGDIGFHTLPVAFADAPPFARFGMADVPALMLGMDALRAFRHVTIDFANREVRFRMPEPVLRPGQWSLTPS